MNLRRYLSDPGYWHRAMLRIIETACRRVHLETHLDRLITDNVALAERGGQDDSIGPGTGIRLLYVAPKFDYGNPARGYSYEENHFLPALASLGFDLLHFDSLTLVRRFGRLAASDLLVELTFRLRPEVAFFVLFKDDFKEAAIEEIRRLGCVTFNWFTDDHWRFESFSSRWASRFSFVITTYADAIPKYRQQRITSVIRSQWGVNHRLYRPIDSPRQYPATFIGQPHGDRRQVIAALRRAGLPVEVWGYRWPRGKLSTRQAVEIINQSEVNLNLSNASVGQVDQIKGRDFEVPACRGLLITKNIVGLTEYFEPGTEILTYNRLDDLVAQIRWALDHSAEAEEVRQAGYRRTVDEHTYEKRFTKIFRQAGVLP